MKRRYKTVVMTFTRLDGGILDFRADCIGGMFPRGEDTVLLSRDGGEIAIVQGDYDRNYSNWVRYVCNPSLAEKQNRDRIYDLCINDDVDYSRQDAKEAVKALRDTGIPEVKK